MAMLETFIKEIETRFDCSSIPNIFVSQEKERKKGTLLILYRDSIAIAFIYAQVEPILGSDNGIRSFMLDKEMLEKGLKSSEGVSHLITNEPIPFIVFLKRSYERYFLIVEREKYNLWQKEILPSKNPTEKEKALIYILLASFKTW